MKNKSFNELLVEDLKPVNVLSLKKIMGSAYFWSAIATAMIWVLFFHLREDMPVAFHLHSFYMSLLGAAASSLLFCGATFSLAVPGRKSATFWFVLSSVFLVALSIGLLFSPNQEVPFGHFEAPAYHCTLSVLFLSALPLFIQLIWMRKLAPTSLLKLGMLAGIGSTLMGAFALSFSCSNDFADHLLIWHLTAPILVFGMTGALVSKKWLRW